MGRVTGRGSSSALRRALFSGGFAGEVMMLISEMWPTFNMHHEVRLEERITALFHDALVDAYERRNWPWFIMTEVPVTDPTFGTQTGRNDLRFYHRDVPGQRTFFVVECKRLHVRTQSGFRHLVDEYVDEGLKRFVENKYAAEQPCASMVAYVMDNEVEVAMNRVQAEITTKSHQLRIKGKPAFKQPSKLLQNHQQSGDTIHLRKHGSIVVHHLLLGVIR